MVLIIGTAERGPTNQALQNGWWDNYDTHSYTPVDLSQPGSFTLTSLDFKFVAYKTLNYWENDVKPAGDRMYRLRVFPIVPGSFTIDQSGPLTRVTTVPTTGQYRLDDESGLLTLGNTSPFTVKYKASTNVLEEITPLDVGLIDHTVSWIDSRRDKVWIQERNLSNKNSLASCFEHGNFGTETFAVRANTGTTATVTVSNTPECRIVLRAELGKYGNQWKACWDHDCIYILQPPGYENRLIKIPLSQEASAYTKQRWSVTPEETLARYNELFAEFVGLELLTPSTFKNYTGGSTGPINWKQTLEYFGLDQEMAIVPLGLEDAEVAAEYIELARAVGVWPLVVMHGSGKPSPYMAMTNGTVTYHDDWEGTPLHALAECISKGNPYYPTKVNSYVPVAGDHIALDKSIRHGWMFARANSTDDLPLNSHLYIQAFARRLRAVLSKYIGHVGVLAEEIGTDPEVVEIMREYLVSYSISIVKHHAEVAVTLRPPGMVSEINFTIGQQL